MRADPKARTARGARRGKKFGWRNVRRIEAIMDALQLPFARTLTVFARK
jgi:hypothetical protein